MKRFFFVIFIIFFVLNSRFVSAQAPEPYSYQYVITEFKSEISVEKDATLLVKETIGVNFPDQRHGIFRIIPVSYTAKGRTIKTGFKDLSITDASGKSYKYEQSRQAQSVNLKSGDPDKTVTGLNTYLITYRISKVIQRFEDHDEVYWNVTGSEWDTDILASTATLSSPYAEIKKVDCFAGTFATTEKQCSSSFNKETAEFSSTNRLGTGRDFTIVIALDKNNQLVFPGRLQNFISALFDNWGYLVSILPFAVIFYIWFKKGRDKKYAGENVYYEPDEKKVITKPIFAREYLPMVYHPIQGLSPSEVGTIVDEKVDIHDVVSEIVELARLGYIKIEKLEKDRLIGKHMDFAFTKIDKETSKLSEYQVFLLEKIFDEDFTSKTIKEAERFFKKDEKKLQEVIKKATDGSYVLLSTMKNAFYKHLDEFKKKLYASLDREKIFDGKPDKVKEKWIGILIVLEIIAFIVIINFVNFTGNFGPLILAVILGIPAFFLALAMPRRTAWGYSLYRQIKGLAFFLDKGKWREEIAEKHLFLQEMLPLAIALGLVDKLASDMQELGVPPPSYIGGVTAASLSGDLNTLESRTSSTLMSAPGGKWSGSSSWSGGSGFSGGSSGGGFGGGGGGSW